MIGDQQRHCGQEVIRRAATLEKAGYVDECTDKATQDHVLKKK